MKPLDVRPSARAHCPPSNGRPIARTGLGAKVWATRAEAELARIGGRAASRWALTPSERSVADLAAAGRSNREIADQLVISVRTVESHLASAYRKLDVRSRVQLAPVLARIADETARTL